MDNTLIELFKIINFYQASVISIAVFVADFISGVTAGIRSGRHMRSSIMHQTLSKKVSNYFFFLIIGLAFYMASLAGNGGAPLAEIATIIVIIPAIPELLSIFENLKIIKTKIDTKPKEDEGE